MKKKVIALVLVCVLVFGVAVGGTLAWLADKTDPVTNTFTVGDVNITLNETTGNTYQVLPGVEIEKDPKVTVLANSEKCYLFVKIEESSIVESDVTLFTYELDGWTEHVDGVYYKIVNKSDEPQEFNVIKDNTITVSDTLTKTQLDKFDGKTPTLTFTAYAVQFDGIADVATAWAAAQRDAK